MSNDPYKFIDTCAGAILVTRMRNETLDSPFTDDPVPAVFNFTVKATTTQQHQGAYKLSVTDTDGNEVEWVTVEGHQLRIDPQGFDSADDGSGYTDLVVEAQNVETGEVLTGATTTVRVLACGTNAPVDPNNITLTTSSNDYEDKDLEITITTTQGESWDNNVFPAPKFIRYAIKNNWASAIDDDNRPAYLMCTIVVPS